MRLAKLTELEYGLLRTGEWRKKGQIAFESSAEGEQIFLQKLAQSCCQLTWIVHMGNECSQNDLPLMTQRVSAPLKPTGNDTTGQVDAGLCFNFRGKELTPAELRLHWTCAMKQNKQSQSPYSTMVSQIKYPWNWTWSSGAEQRTTCKELSSAELEH